MDKVGLVSRMKHYGCIVDLLGKARYLEEADKTLKTMLDEPNAIILSSFLFACRCLKDVLRTERIISRIVIMEP